MTNVEITRSPVQKEKPKLNRDIRSIFNDMTKVSKHKNDGKLMKNDNKDRLSLLTCATFIRNAPLTPDVLSDIL